ncbi:MAG: TIM44-like domain-containing protein [Pseudolabrys sp.]|nr:TIM44-like domain-containing protein [Pseudolabrys sp.]MDP2294879.1 TIM44-like domain-containing protein [Pseudolabrys sp.]
MMRHRWLIALAAIATVFVFVAADYADARGGRGGSFGSRGARTFTPPAATNTAPTAAAPIQRSVTQPSAATAGAAGAAARPGIAGGGMFGGGLLGGLAAGFIGAGLFGMLFGGGFMAGMGGFASILGLLLQVALVVIVARLAFAWWQRRKAPAVAMQSAGNTPGAASGPSTQAFGGLGTMFGGNAPAAPVGTPVTLEKSDFDDFETLLGDVQAAYSAEDLAALRAKATPEMVSYFAEELTDNASRGVVNQVTDVKLLQGDLSEAWREGDREYATVAMHFALTDTTADRASGKVVEGGQPGEVTELWTFLRLRGGEWMLSAIQQA